MVFPQAAGLFRGGVLLPFRWEAAQGKKKTTPGFVLQVCPAQIFTVKVGLGEGTMWTLESGSLSFLEGSIML